MFWFSRHPSTACSATSMMSSDSRLPFGHPCGSPPSGPSRLHAGAESVPHSGVLRLTLSSSLGVTPLGLFTPVRPVRNTEMRSLRWIPFLFPLESGIFSPYRAWITCGRIGFCTAPRNWESLAGLDPLK